MTKKRALPPTPVTRAAPAILAGLACHMGAYTAFLVALFTEMFGPR